MDNPTLQPVGMVGMDFTTHVMARSINKKLSAKMARSINKNLLYKTSPKAKMELQKWRRMEDGIFFSIE